MNFDCFANVLWGRVKGQSRCSHRLGTVLLHPCPNRNSLGKLPHMNASFVTIITQNVRVMAHV